MRKDMIKKLCNVMMAFVLMIAPVASGYCRSLFYEEKEPEGLQEFAKKCKEGK